MLIYSLIVLLCTLWGHTATLVSENKALEHKSSTQKTNNLYVPGIANSGRMLSSMVKEHHQKQVVRKEIQEVKRKEACGAASNLTQALVDHLNVGVAQAYLNQKRLDAEAKQLHTSATNFSKQTQQWLNLVETFSSALKEIGDVENWAKTIEGDVRTITIALESVYKSSQEASQSQ